jgi:hypothetical protein
MRRMFLPFLFICSVLLPSISISQDDPSINNPEVVSFEGCEYTVFFPTSTKQKVSYVGEFKSVMVQSVYDGKSPFMRAECFPLSNRSETLSNFKAILENHAKLSGIKEPQITIEDNELGRIGTYSGVRKVGGFNIKFFGKVIIGRFSILSLLVSEELSQFPSDKSVFFINTIRRK